MSYLRKIQQARWVERREGVQGLAELFGGKVPKGDHRAMLEQQEGRILEELREARAAVDAELEEGRGRLCIVEAMRASPQRPDSVVEFQDVTSFVMQDQRRAVPGWPSRKDAGGMDLGIYWRLENPFRSWETTSWRMSWLGTTLVAGVSVLPSEGRTDEIYTIELFDNGRTGRVWLLGKLRTRALVDRAVDDLRCFAMRERNSVAAAAAAVAAVMEEEERSR